MNSGTFSKFSKYNNGIIEFIESLKAEMNVFDMNAESIGKKKHNEVLFSASTEISGLTEGLEAYGNPHYLVRAGDFSYLIKPETESGQFVVEVKSNVKGLSHTAELTTHRISSDGLKKEILKAAERSFTEAEKRQLESIPYTQPKEPLTQP